MVLFLLIQVVITLIILRFLRFSLLSPAFLYVFPWVIPLFLISINLFDYEHAVNNESFIILALAFFIFPLGAVIHRLLLKPSKLKSQIKGKRHKSFLERPIWIWGGWMMILLYGGLIISQYASTIAIGLSTANLSAIRSIHWANAGANTGVIGLLIALTRPFSTISLASFPLRKYVTKKNTRALAIMAFLSLLFLSLEEIGKGGRDIIVFHLLVVLYAFLFVKHKGYLTIAKIINPKSISLIFKIALIGVPILYFFMIWVPYARNPNLYDNFTFFFERRSQVHLSTLSNTLISCLGEKNTLPFFTSLSYFTNPIPNLTFYYIHSNFERWYIGGTYTFPLFSKILNAIQGNAYSLSWQTVRANLGAINASMGYADNPWATGLRSLLVDFGETGTLFFLFLFGFFSDSLFLSARKRPSVEKIILLSLTSPILLVFAFYEYMSNGTFIYPVVLISIIMLMQRVNFPFIKKVRYQEYEKNHLIILHK